MANPLSPSEAREGHQEKKRLRDLHIVADAGLVHKERADVAESALAAAREEVETLKGQLERAWLERDRARSSLSTRTVDLEVAVADVARLQQEKETLAKEVRSLLERLGSARPLNIGSIDTHRGVHYATSDIARLAALLDPVEGT